MSSRHARPSRRRRRRRNPSSARATLTTTTTSTIYLHDFPPRDHLLPLSHFHLPVPLLLLLFLLLLHPHPVSTKSLPFRPRFSDVSSTVGLPSSRPRRIKYGGACIADVDGDGRLDLLLGHHDHPYIDLLYGLHNHTFARRPDWNVWADVHGINAARLTPFHRGMHFVVSRGGSRGDHPNSPMFFRVSPDSQAVEEESTLLSAQFTRGRGRSAVFVHVGKRPKKGVMTPIVVLLNAPSKPGVAAHRVVRPVWTKSNTTKENKMHMKRVPVSPGRTGFAVDGNSYGTVTDIDGDGLMELVTWHNFAIYKLRWSSSRPVRLLVDDITLSVLPSHLHGLRGISAVAELDYDNDGHVDLFITRTAYGELKWLRSASNGNSVDTGDILLRNVDGQYYEDVSVSAGIPRWNTRSQGVTAADVNNDGHTDLLVSQYDTRDTVFLNRGDGTFGVVPMSLKREGGAAGDQMMAVDYDGDGRIDILSSEGEWFDKTKAGRFRMLRNVTPRNWKKRNWIVVKVGNAPRNRATALHASVGVCVGSTKSNEEWKCQTKRVGSPGTAVSNSNVNHVHFGLGGYGVIAKVWVRWVDGQTKTRWKMKANRVVPFGET